METTKLLNYIYEAETAFEKNELFEGMRYLENALSIEPTYAKAHNHMGWLYLYHFEDWKKAEIHFNLALKYESNYGATYLHLSHLLFESNRFEELSELLAKALHVGSVSKSFIYNEFGRMHEVLAKLKKAIKYYKEAIKWSFDEKELNIITDNIRRARRKRWYLTF